MYEWDHARQLLHLRTAEATGDATARGSDALESELYTERFLVRRPLLQALAPTQGAGPRLLLIDELDRAAADVVALLLELLAARSVPAPKIGTFKSGRPT